MSFAITIIAVAQKTFDAEKNATKNDSNIKKIKFFNEHLNKEKKVLIINFWASWCTPCIKELPALNRLHLNLGEKGLNVITINTDVEDQKKLSQKIFKKYNLKLQNILDKGGYYVDLFSITGVPTTFLVKNNKIIRKIEGEFDFDSKDFLNNLDTLFAK